ncbi:hypothetical protein CDL15_Pgr013606 [Punica granatum]|uniref:Pentatricopeptide repeat-containing protein At5g66500, mitochondrial n=1 Tax=Punica granatum TaxID=22663 RepID=A0A218W1J7_PUNGR|nr:hypothetical protein CDL15_Pgr013606 [Punica granatum]
MLTRDILSYNSRLASLVRLGESFSAWVLFVDLHRSRTDLDPYTFTPILNVCPTLPHLPKLGEQVHSLMIKTGSDLGTVSKTALVNMYSKYRLLCCSEKAFEELESKDVVSWNVMISSFLSHGLAKDAIRVFERMRQDYTGWNEFTLCSVLKACTLLRAFPQGKQVHSMVVVMGRDLVVLGTALIDFYSNVGQIDKAMKVYSILCRSSDGVMRNSMIAGCVKNQRYKEAFEIMSSMRPNVVALTTALAACSENSDLWIGKQIHCIATRLGFVSDTQLCNAVLDMYGKSGKIASSKSVFDLIPWKDVVSWTAMIDAYRVHGCGLQAFALFNEMVESRDRVCPNSVTLLAVLSACGHSGLLEQGRACFEFARDKYKLEVYPEHYACFIDSLGRAGHMEDVWLVFLEMVKEKNCRLSAKVWAALLNACRLNGDISRGEYATKGLLELEPSNPGNYVLACNFYAAIGRWDLVEEMRIEMRKRRMNKKAGSSWVTCFSSRKT